MIGRIIGAMECVGLVSLFAHYSGLEKLTQWQLYFGWIMVVIPLIVLTVAMYYKYKNVDENERRMFGNKNNE